MQNHSLPDADNGASGHGSHLPLEQRQQECRMPRTVITSDTPGAKLHVRLGSTAKMHRYRRGDSQNKSNIESACWHQCRVVYRRRPSSGSPLQPWRPSFGVKQLSSQQHTAWSSHHCHDLYSQQACWYAFAVHQRCTEGARLQTTAHQPTKASPSLARVALSTNNEARGGVQDTSSTRISHSCSAPQAPFLPPSFAAASEPSDVAQHPPFFIPGCPCLASVYVHQLINGLESRHWFSC